MTEQTAPVEPAGGEAPASVTPETEIVAPDTTPDVAEESETNEPQEKPKGGFQRRIQELVSERNEYRRREAEKDRRIDQLIEMLTPRPEPPKAVEAPTLEQFGHDEQQYQAAFLEYAKAEARKEAQQALRDEREQERAQTRAQTFKTREADFAKSVDDYADVVYDRSTPISKAMAEVITESEVGPELAYYLAKNRSVAESIYAMSPIAAGRELGRIEAKLTQPSRPQPSPIPKAPPPPPKVDAVEPEVQRDPDKMSMNDWLKWREKQIAKRYR